MAEKALNVGIGPEDVPEFVQSITKHLVAIDTLHIEDGDLQVLLKTMASRFTLCAYTFSKLFGPRFVAIVNGDLLTQQELSDSIGAF